MLKWKKEYEIGVERIDIQHKKLVDIGEQVYKLIIKDGDHYDDIVTLLHELKDYTIYHFKTEEDLFEKHPEFLKAESHIFEHRLFVKKIEKYFEDLELIDKEQKKVLLDLMTFISDWLVQHIVGSDKEYAPYIG